MTSRWDQFHIECRPVSNASIICGDGVIFTHKLILANISKLLENILKDIPPADEVTIYLKIFSKRDVEQFLFDISMNRESSQRDLYQLLGNKDKSSKPPVKFEALCDVYAEKSSKKSMKGEIKEENENDLDTEEYIFSEAMWKDGEFSCEASYEAFDEKTEEKIKEYEKELVKDPISKEHQVNNKRIAKKIRYEKALAAYKSGRVKSYKEAALKYGVNDQQIRKYHTEGTFFQGGGKQLKRFTWEEEKHIAERVLNMTHGGKKFSIVQDVLLEEAEIIKVNQPERSEQMTFPTNQKLISFTRSFARRHGLENRSETDEDLKKKNKPEKRDNEFDTAGGEKASTEIKEMDPAELEEFDRKTEDLIKEYEKDLIENPTTEKQKAANLKLDKKIRYEKALAAYKTARVKSFRQAALKFGVCDTVLRRMLAEGTSFVGKGNMLKRFTAEEEKHIADRIWKLTEGGTVLTNKIVQAVLLEEAEVVKVNQPERTDQMTFATNQKLASFALAFTRRHEMADLCDAESRKDRDQRRIHECEVCYRTFTFQNSLVAHRRKCHSFLFSRS